MPAEPAAADDPSQVPFERPITYAVEIEAGPHGMDHEVAMIGLATEALRHLEPDAQERACLYLARRFGGE